MIFFGGELISPGYNINSMKHGLMFYLYEKIEIKLLMTAQGLAHSRCQVNIVTTILEIYSYYLPTYHSPVFNWTS